MVLWLEWMKRMLFLTFIISASIALFILVGLYIKQGLPKLSFEILSALLDIFMFWFLLVINFVIPIALFISTKFLFNKPVNGFTLKLLTCPKDKKRDILEEITYGDIVKVWRKFFFLLIWMSAIFVMIGIVFFYLFTSYKSLFSWFNIYLLYSFILLSGYPSILLLASRCKKIRIVTC